MNKSSMLKRTAVGASSGLLIGGLAVTTMGMRSADSQNLEGRTDANHNSGLTHPEWVDNEIPVATSVTDEMSFGQAFANARAEVGAGGCFEWHGQLYGIYTADEWNNMTEEQRAEWSDHFIWNQIDHSSSDVSQYSKTFQQETTSDDIQQPAFYNDIEIVSVERTDGEDLAFEDLENNEIQPSIEIEVQAVEPEIEILGIDHDNKTDSNFDDMSIDGEGVIIIDVDSDPTFDNITIDSNDNDQIADNEIIDIQNQNLTVNEIVDFSDPINDLYVDTSD